MLTAALLVRLPCLGLPVVAFDERYNRYARIGRPVLNKYEQNARPSR